jgi:CheB methylesterase
VLIVIGASAGGIETLVQLVQRLPPGLPAAIGIVHIPINVTSILPQMLNRAGTLPARHANNGENLQPGHIYVAPPNHHCHGGHADSAENFFNGQSEALEAALWTAVRTLEEKASLSRRLAENARRHGRNRSGQHFAEQEQEAEQQVARRTTALDVDRGKNTRRGPLSC